MFHGMYHGCNIFVMWKWLPVVVLDQEKGFLITSRLIAWTFFWVHIMWTPILYKKVLLRERKRRTDHHVASTPSVVLTGGGTLGTPHLNLDLAGGYPIPGGGTWGYPPSGPGWGTPLSKAGWGTPLPIWTWPGYPPRCGQTENITFPHPSHAVSKYYINRIRIPVFLMFIIYYDVQIETRSKQFKNAIEIFFQDIA